MLGSPDTWTWGLELEWGDVDRRLNIPPGLGSWSMWETEVLNLRAPYAGIACDPLGVNPPFGGEINTKPSVGWEGQLDKFEGLVEFFGDAGCAPTITCLQGIHIHVHVPGLREDLPTLKRMAEYVRRNQEDYIQAVHGYFSDARIRACKATRTMSRSAKKIPEWMLDNLQRTESVEHFMKVFRSGKDGWKIDANTTMPQRHSVNIYNLSKIDTLEYRAPRSTLDVTQLRDLLSFHQRMTEASLRDGQSVADLLKSQEWSFPLFRFQPAHYQAWEATKHKVPGGNRGAARKFWRPEDL